MTGSSASGAGALRCGGPRSEDALVADDRPRGGDDRRLVDADDFLALTGRLRRIHHRLDEARISDEQRSRWQRRLISITEVAGRDLGRAEEQLNRFEHDLDRQLG